MLHRLGYSALMPRPRHRKADAVSHEQFTKDAPPLVENLRREHPERIVEI
jgi:hypothetical protein